VTATPALAPAPSCPPSLHDPPVDDAAAVDDAHAHAHALHHAWTEALFFAFRDGNKLINQLAVAIGRPGTVPLATVRSHR
jgi:hypothetical protein